MEGYRYHLLISTWILIEGINVLGILLPLILRSNIQVPLHPSEQMSCHYLFIVADTVVFVVSNMVILSH